VDQLVAAPNRVATDFDYYHGEPATGVNASVV
jgi:hypothetical protein